MTAAIAGQIAPTSESAMPPTRFGELDVPSEAELAAAWDISERTVQRLALPFVLIGRHRYYPWPRVVEELRRRAR